MKNYSSVYNSISFKFLNNPPKKREAKVLMPYGIHPEVEILSHFEDNKKLSVDTFHLALGLLKEAILRIPYAPAKKEFDFDVEGLLRDISTVIKDAPNSIQELKFLDDNKKQFTLQNRLNHKLRIIQNFKENPRPLDTRIIGVRIFSNFQFDDDEDVYFYQNMYSIIFSDVLYWHDIRLPGFKEIYIELVDSVEEAIDISTSKDDWFQYTHAILDYNTFKQASQEIKEQLFLKSIIEGLRYITDFDHLEVNKIEGAIKYIQKHKLNTPLTYEIKENDEYKVIIHYTVTRETIIRNYVKAIYNIHVFQKATGKESVKQLGIYETFNVPYILGSITLTKKQVTIKGRKGLRADVYRSSEKAPIEFKFEFQKLFLTNEEGGTVD